MARDEEYHQPLLGSHENGETIFAVEDDSDDEGVGVVNRPTPANKSRSVRFEEEPRVIAPSLRSTTSSREAEFDLDDEDVEETDLHALEYIPTRRRSEQSMPLLVGLMDASSSRQGLDRLPVSHNHANEEAELEEIAAKRTAGGSMLDSIANMANSILGAGIIGLPYAINQAGFFVGLVLLVVLCIVTDWTIRLIVINAKLSGSTSYIDIMTRCFGSSGRAAVSFFQFAFAFGGMCAFGIIIGDTIPHVIRSLFPRLPSIPVLSIFANRQFIIALCTICVSYPLSLYRDIHKLSRASGLALISMLVIVAAVTIEGPKVPDTMKGDPSKRFSFLGPGLFQAIGVVSFAFVCHHNSLLIYGSLRTPTLDRFAKVTHLSTFVSLVACCTLAIPGYMTFTDKTQGNILNNFSANNTFINIARFCFGLNMFTTLPLELFVCREVIEHYFFSHETFNMQRHVFFTTVILIAAMFVSLITCDLGVMLEITGGASATTLAYIFPAACYIQLQNPARPWYSRQKLPAYATCAFGFVVMVFTLCQALAKSWTPEGDPKICT